MNLDEVVSRAQQLLAALGRFGSPMDSMNVSNLAQGQDFSWQSDPVEIKLNRRAWDLLRKLDFVYYVPGGYQYELSPRGRAVLASGWPAELIADWLNEWIEQEELLDALSSQRISAENSVSKLVVDNWRQFSNVEILFHPRLTVLTGANGAGKTTLLNILGPQFNWSAQLVSRKTENRHLEQAREVGHLVYSNGASSPLVHSPSTGVGNVPLMITQMQPVPGLFINSHRSISTYQPLAALPARFSAWDAIQQQFASEIQIRYSGGSSQYSPLYRMKESLVAAAMYAYGNQAFRANDSARELWEGYQTVLRRFLPRSLQFDKLQIDDSEVIVMTKTTEFPIEAASGGVSAMLELSWQIYLRQRNQKSFTVCIDEPENHLHPELQRSIIPSLLAGFPEVTFIISTHSPFVVTSTRDSFVYSLRPDQSGKISSRRIEEINNSATPDETLMSVLGLDTTLPIWAEARLTELIQALPATPSVDDLRVLRDQLKELGLDRQFAAAVQSLDVQE